MCIVDGDGEQLECFSSRAQAETFLAGIQVGPKEEASPSASASPRRRRRLGVAVRRTVAGRERYCLTDADGRRIGCFTTRAKAEEAQEALKIEVTERTYCVIPAPPEPTTRRRRRRPSASALRRLASASPSASPSPATFADLDLSGADAAALRAGSREEADDALAAIEVVHEEQQFCVVSSAGQDLGCFVRREEAEELQRQTGQQRLLRVIGETARLEERRVLEIIPGDPDRSTRSPAGPQEERDSPMLVRGARDAGGRLSRAGRATDRWRSSCSDPS